METILNDVRYALRSMKRSPVFTLIAVLTLAIGIGANGAIFSVINGVILKPLAYRDPGRLMMIYSQFPTMDFNKFWVSGPEYLELRERSRSFSEIGAWVARDISVVGGEQPLRVSGAFVSRTLFEVLGVEAIRGRYFAAEEDLPNGEAVAVLSHDLWQGSFGGDEEILGSRLEVNGTPTTIIGVMPPHFDVDENDVEIWLPLALDPASPGGRASHYLYMVGRLEDGVTADQARAELELLVAGWEEASGGGHVPSPEGHPLAMNDLHTEVVGDTRPALFALFGAVGFVLLIACVNVANLLLARAETRHKEMAIRTAMGAGRVRLLRQLLTESVVLATLGGILGLFLASWGLKALLAANPDSLPRTAEVGLDLPVLIFTLLVAALTGVLFGLAPAISVRLGHIGVVLKEGGQRTTAGGGRMHLRRLLVITEIALAVVLVVCSGLMIKSFYRILSVDTGFDASGRVTFETYLPPTSYPQPTDVAAFYSRLMETFEAVPGIDSAAVMTGLPPLRRINANTMEFEGLEETEDGPPHNMDYWQFVSPGYFDSLGIGIVYGRGFEPTDDGASTPVVLVNEQAAGVFWPGENPIGRRLRQGSGPWLTIIGIVRDVKQQGVDQETGTELYFHLPQAVAAGFAPRTMNVVVSSSLSEASLMQELRRQVWALDPALPLAGLRSMKDVVGDSLAQPRFLTQLLVLFGGIALALAAVGTYGVISYSVAQRRQEIGIRMAMGAQSGSVVGLILRQAAMMVVIGLAIGIIASLFLTRLVASLLFATSSTDPLTFVWVSALLATTAALACWLPARRAAKLDPLLVLRSE